MEKFKQLLEKDYSIIIKDRQDLEVSFRKLEIDSLQIVALITSLENLYKIEFSIDELDEVNSLKDLYECIERKIK